MKRPVPLVALFVLMIAWSFGASTDGFAQEPVVQNAAPGLPVFPNQDGWLGADRAYSIPLGKSKSLWLFGDTFVGDHSTTVRSKVVHNSVGIGTCRPKESCTIHYYWRNQQSANPRPFFDTGMDDLWYWPLDGYLDGNTLHLAVLIVANRPAEAGGSAAGFLVRGTKWITVTNASAAPNQWQIAVTDMTHGNLSPGVSVIADASQVLLYSLLSESPGRGYMLVLRAERKLMDDPASNWEYLGKDHAWHAGYPGLDAMHIIDQPISEMSVRYHPAARKWIAISTGPEPASSHIVARAADSPTGPWSEPKEIFQFPEMTPGAGSYDKDTFCDAAMEHVEIDNSRLVVTYVCNSNSPAKMADNMNIDRPQVVVLPLPF